MYARCGVHTALFWGEDRRACGGPALLATPLVPGHPGLRPRRNSLHCHHLHTEVKASARQAKRKMEKGSKNDSFCLSPP